MRLILVHCSIQINIISNDQPIFSNILILQVIWFRCDVCINLILQLRKNFVDFN